MNKKIIIAGGTGFIGSYLVNQFQLCGYDVQIISRRPEHIKWDNEAAIIKALENAEILINLAGKSINCRFTDKNKKALLESRIQTTLALGNAITKCQSPPPLWINASAMAVYASSYDKPMTEANGKKGIGFANEMATAWEETFFSFKFESVRQVAFRMAVVIGKDGGVMKPLINLTRFGLGGKQGNGKQMFSWIHVQDLFNIIAYVNEHKQLSGPVNCCSPEAVDNNTVMKTLRKAMNIPFGIPATKWMVQIGAFVLQTEPDLILGSNYVYPQKLIEHGFKFSYPDLSSAVKASYKNSLHKPLEKKSRLQSITAFSIPFVLHIFK